MRQIILDTETTGLDPQQGHRIVEIACVEMINRRLTRNNFQSYLNPEREIEPGAEQVHGLSLDFLSSKPVFREIAEAFLEYISSAELIIHNAPFDIGFLNAELARLEKPPINTLCKITDTLAMARELHPGRKNNLNALCERYQVDNAARTLHGALLDAELLADVYLAMTRGQDSLAIGFEGGTDRAVEITPLQRPATLKVIRADEQERALHAAQIARIDKESSGKALWKVF